MQPAARPVDDGALGARVQGNLFALFRAMAALEGAELEERGTLAVHHAWPENPMFKGVWAPRLAADEADVAIDEALAWFAARRAPFAFWWTGPGTTPDDLPARLERRGWALFERDAPGMAARIDALDRSVRERLPTGYVEAVARDAADLDHFATVFVQSFGLPSWAAQAWVDATTALTPERAPWTIVVGRLDGRPVAATIAFAADGDAGVYGVGVVPEARRLGLGAAITLAGLDRVGAGCSHAVLFSTPEGEPVYRSIGFEHVAARISRWLWRAS